MTATYQSKICAIAHNAMERLFAVGLLDAERMFEFDLLCLSEIGRDEYVSARHHRAAAAALPTTAPDSAKIAPPAPPTGASASFAAPSAA